MGIFSAPPRGPLRLLLRAPIVLYRCRLGWMLGRRLVMLTHTGRKSGRKRHTVLEVVRQDDARGIFIVCSGWGRNAQWFQNVLADPLVWVTAGLRPLPMRARQLPPAEAEREFRDYAARFPRNIRMFSLLFLGRAFSGGDEDFAALSHDLPLVELSPRTPRGREEGSVTRGKRQIGSRGKKESNRLSQEYGYAISGKPTIYGAMPFLRN